MKNWKRVTDTDEPTIRQAIDTTQKSVQIDDVKKASRLIEDLVEGTMLLKDRLSGQDKVQASRMHDKALDVMSLMNVARRIE